jgi:hypothetical protein
VAAAAFERILVMTMVTLPRVIAATLAALVLIGALNKAGALHFGDHPPVDPMAFHADVH